MATIYDVPVNDLLEEVAKELQQVGGIKAPSWAAFVKTGMHKERPPAREDWWYMRCAAVLRRVRILGPVGTSKLRTKFGGRHRRGHQAQHFARGSGNIIRKCLQQLEAAELIKKENKGVHKGRVVTGKGMSLMDKAASKLYTPVGKKVKPEAKPEEEVKPKGEAKVAPKPEVKKEEAKPAEEKKPAEAKS